MKIEVEIPQEYIQRIEETAEKQGVSADEIVEIALKKFLERSLKNAGN